MPNTAPQKPRPSQKRIAAVIATIAEQTGFGADAIRYGSRSAKLTAARWMAWRQLCEVEGFGLSPTAKAWGCHHASIINARRQGWAKAEQIPTAGAR